MELNEVIKNRYSCRSFAPAAVEKEKLEAILEAGRLAPTAKNLQEQHIYVLGPEAAARLIDPVTPCRYGAPVVLVTAFNKNNVFTYPGGKRTSGVEDAAIVATHMILEACNQGLGSLWINNFNPDTLHEIMALPEDEEILMLMAIGYPAADAAPSANHARRKPLSETVTWI